MPLVALMTAMAQRRRSRAPPTRQCDEDRTSGVPGREGVRPRDSSRRRGDYGRTGPGETRPRPAARTARRSSPTIAPRPPRSRPAPHLIGHGASCPAPAPGRRTPTRTWRHRAGDHEDGDALRRGRTGPRVLRTGSRRTTPAGREHHDVEQDESAQTRPRWVGGLPHPPTRAPAQSRPREQPRTTELESDREDEHADGDRRYQTQHRSLESGSSGKEASPRRRSPTQGHESAVRRTAVVSEASTRARPGLRTARGYHMGWRSRWGRVRMPTCSHCPITLTSQ